MIIFYEKNFFKLLDCHTISIYYISETIYILFI